MSEEFQAPPFLNSTEEDQSQEPQEETNNVTTQQEPSNAPVTNLNSFSPNVGQEESIICEMTPSDFDTFVKILETFDKESSTKIIKINNSYVIQGTSDCIMEADFSNTMKYNGQLVNLEIVNPKKTLDALSKIKTNNNIFILETDSQYVVTTEKKRRTLNKATAEASGEMQPFDLSNAELITDQTIAPEDRNDIKLDSKNSQYIDLLIYDDNKFKATYCVTDDGECLTALEEFKDDVNKNKLNEDNANLILRSTNFFPIDSKGDARFQIYKLSDSDYVTVATITVGNNVQIKVSEAVKVSTGGNIFLE